MFVLNLLESVVLLQVGYRNNLLHYESNLTVEGEKCEGDDSYSESVSLALIFNCFTVIPTCGENVHFHEVIQSCEILTYFSNIIALLLA